MAEKDLQDEAHINTRHEQRFTITDVPDLTGRVIKWAMSAIDPKTGAFSTTALALEKTNQTPGDMALIDGPNGIIDVIIEPADTVALAAIDYHFQMEVFDGVGADGVVTSQGTITFLPNLVETV